MAGNDSKFVVKKHMVMTFHSLLFTSCIEQEIWQVPFSTSPSKTVLCLEFHLLQDFFVHSDFMYPESEDGFYLQNL